MYYLIIIFSYKLATEWQELYEGGNGAKHNLISPKDATSYFTISGKSFPKYISK